MNTLSIIIYIANTLPDITKLLVIAICLLFITGFLSLLFILSAAEEFQSKMSRRGYLDTLKLTKEDLEKDLVLSGISNTLNKSKNFFKRIVITLIIIFPIPFLIPSKETILLIAASQFGEKIIKHENVAKIVDPSVEYLSEWIKNETNNLKVKTDEIKTKAQDMKSKIDGTNK